MIEYLAAAKTLLDIFKGIKSEMPPGNKTDEAQTGIERAEAALATTEAEVAKALGFKLCKCTFPPQVMLWKQDVKTNVCLACGHQNPPRHRDPDVKPASRFGGMA